MTRMNRMNGIRAAQRPIIGVGSALIVAGALVSTFAGPATAAVDQSTGGTPYGGFTTSAEATPLRIELYEPTIPIPANPQVELNYSYTQVSGSSGPDSTARASALWPGESVGTGLPAIFQTQGIPPTLLGKDGYPVQVNAQYPGQPNSGSQEPLPGQVDRVSASNQQASARAGYSSSGQVAGDSSANSISSALSQLQSGNLGALGSLLSPGSTSPGAGSNPLGVLSALISVSGMSSSSVTDYSDPATVTATGTSQIGDLELLGGLVKLEGFTTSSASTSSLSGAAAVQKVTYGGLTIQGQAFKVTADGIEAAGSTKPSPDPSQATAALAKYGISLTFPKPTQTASGSTVSAAAQGVTLTIDTAPIVTMLQLNKIPLSSITNQFPASADQLKQLLVAALTAHPKIVLKLGNVDSSAQTIGAVSLGGPGGGAAGGVAGGLTSGSTGSAGSSGVPAGSGVSGTPAGGSAATGATTTPIQKTAALPGLPPLGSVPSLLILGGLIIAAGLGWFFRAAALTALGAGSTCTHGLVTGLPDLRKA